MSESFNYRTRQEARAHQARHQDQGRRHEGQHAPPREQAGPTHRNAEPTPRRHHRRSRRGADVAGPHSTGCDVRRFEEEARPQGRVRESRRARSRISSGRVASGLGAAGGHVDRVAASLPIQRAGPAGAQECVSYRAAAGRALFHRACRGGFGACGGLLTTNFYESTPMTFFDKYKELAAANPP